MEDVLIIGAGVGGLTTGAILARAGIGVTVLEAHVYAGGSAGTFFHQNYRFEAGATLAGGFYPGGPMDLVAGAAGVKAWPVRHSSPAMVVVLPDGRCITRWGDARRWEERARMFSPKARGFWAWQERTADMLWDFALRSPAWPPQSPREVSGLLSDAFNWQRAAVPFKNLPGLGVDALRPIAAHLPENDDALRMFIDAQLLISAQTTSPYANALFGASALDLPRRGVVHVRGGMGGIANTLVEAIRGHGGRVLFRHEVTGIEPQSDGHFRVMTKRKGEFSTRKLVANLPPWNIRQLMGDASPRRVQNLPEMPADGWGAFMVYLGVKDILPKDFPLHHQVIAREPLGEGNTIFLSISPGWDVDRAPAGHRAVTISTHTRLKDWWDLFEKDPGEYQARKDRYAAEMVALAERVVPGISSASKLVLPGTPVTFQRFTRRRWGWVGGFPQTHLFRTWPPQLARNLWMVGDSIFPGQSTAAVALGGMRVAESVRIALRS